MLLSILIRYFGLIEVQTNTKLFDSKIHRKWPCYRIYAILLGTLFMCTSVYSLHEDYRLYTNGHGERIRTWPQVFVVIADQLSSSVAVFIGLTMINIKYNKLIEVSRSYRDLEKMLGARKGVPKYYRTVLAMYLIFLSIFLPLNIYDYLDNLTELLIYLPTYLVYLPLVALQIFYMIHVLELQDMMKHINANLPAILSTSSSYSRYSLAGCLIWKISLVKRNLETLFGVPVLLLSAHNLLHNIVTPYYVCVNLLLPEISRYQLTTWSFQGVWLMVHAANLICMLWPGESFCRQGKTTGLVIANEVHKSKSDHHRRMLKSLMLQLKATDFRVSICGLYRLDCKLIRPMFLNIITYLIVLIQLKN